MTKYAGYGPGWAQVDPVPSWLMTVGSFRCATGHRANSRPRISAFALPIAPDDLPKRLSAAVADPTRQIGQA